MSLSAENASKMFSCENSALIAKETLHEMWNFAKDESLFCDVTLIAKEDGKKIAAHRAVLSARNEYFKSMFTGQFQEAKNKEVTISEVSGDVLRALVRYCYTGNIDINADNAQLILPQASLMMFPEIVEACSLFLIASINPANCLHIAKYAKLYDLQGLLKSAEDHMKKNFVNVVITDSFLKLNEEELQEYLSFVELNVDSEKEKFEAMMRWIEYDSKARSCTLSNLLSLIQLQQIEKNYLLEFVLKNTRKEYHLTLTDAFKENLSKAQIVPEKVEKNASKIVVVCRKQIQVYDLLNNAVEFKCSISVGCGKDFEPTLFGEKVIFVCENGKFRCLDLKTNDWHDLASTLTEISMRSVAALNDCVYAVGGEVENCQTLNTVERWDSKLNEWNVGASMNHQRFTHCIAILNSKLYAIGGWANKTALNSVECYDPIANEWSVCNPMLTARSFARAVVANNEIFVFGGITNNVQSLNSIEKYNADTNTWSEVAAMCCKRSIMGAYLFNNKIYLLGGYNFESDKWIKSVEEFDLATNECKLIDSLNIEIGRFMHCFPYLSGNKK